MHLRQTLVIDRARSQSQGGQTVPLLAAVVALAGLLALGVTQTAGTAARAARAQAVADAAALAGAADGRVAAARLVVDQRAELVSWRRTHDGVEVEVRFRGAVAVARASATGSWPDQRWSGDVP